MTPPPPSSPPPPSECAQLSRRPTLDGLYLAYESFAGRPRHFAFMSPSPPLFPKGPQSWCGQTQNIGATGTSTCDAVHSKWSASLSISKMEE